MQLTECSVLMVSLALVACVPPRQQLGSTAPSQIPTSCANLVNADTAVYDPTELTEQPRARVVPPLTYPPEADRAKIHGRVVLITLHGVPLHELNQYLSWRMPPLLTQMSHTVDAWLGPVVQRQ